MTISKQALSLLAGASVAAMVAGAAQATPYRMETHGYMDHGKLVVTSTKVTDLANSPRKKGPTYTTYSASYTASASAPLKVATLVTQLGYFTVTASNACIGIPKGKFVPAVKADLNGKWAPKTLPPATSPYTGPINAAGATCTGGVITNFVNSTLSFTWSNKAAAVGATDVGTALYTVKALDYGSTTTGFIVDDTFTSTVTYCGAPTKGTTTCP